MLRDPKTFNPCNENQTYDNFVFRGNISTFVSHLHRVNGKGEYFSSIMLKHLIERKVLFMISDIPVFNLQRLN